MSEIALYNTLRKIPDVSDNEAKEAVADVASSRDVAKKADIKDMATKTDLAELETRLIAEMYRMNNRTIMWMVGVGIAVAGVVITVLG